MRPQLSKAPSGYTITNTAVSCMSKERPRALGDPPLEQVDLDRDNR